MGKFNWDKKFKKEVYLLNTFFFFHFLLKWVWLRESDTSHRPH